MSLKIEVFRYPSGLVGLEFDAGSLHADPSEIVEALSSRFGFARNGEDLHTPMGTWWIGLQRGGYMCALGQDDPPMMGMCLTVLKPPKEGEELAREIREYFLRTPPKLVERYRVPRMQVPRPAVSRIPVRWLIAVVALVAFLAGLLSAIFRR